MISNQKPGGKIIKGNVLLNKKVSENNLIY